MGATQSIPVIGEVVTVADSAGRAIAGTVTRPFDVEASDKLYKSAGQTWVDYSDRSAITSNIRVAVASAEGDTKERDRLLKAQGDAWTQIGEGTPVIGHIKGVVNLAQGDNDAAERSFTNATRTAVVIGTTAAAASAGPLAAGAAAVASGAAYDGIATGVSSAAHGEYHPSGYVEGVTRAVKSGDATDIYAAASAPVADFAAGAMAGRGAASGARLQTGLVEKGPVGVGISARTIRQTAGELAQEVERAEPREIQHGTRPQLPLQNLHGVVRITRAEDFLTFLEDDAKSARMKSPALEQLMDDDERRKDYVTYNFVRVRRLDANDHYVDSGFRTISAVDARSQIAQRARTAGPGAPREYIGHSSLVDVAAGEECIAAGEIHISRKGVVLEINEESGHYQFPLEQLRRQTGRAWPIHKFLAQHIANKEVYRSDLRMLNNLFEEENPGLTHELVSKARIIQRTTGFFFILNTLGRGNLDEVPYHLHLKRADVKPVLTLAFANREGAELVFNAVDSTKYAKVVSRDVTNEILLQSAHAETAALVARVPTINALKDEVEPDPKGNALCFPQFYSVAAAGIDSISSALTASADMPQGGHIFVGRCIVDGEYLACGVSSARDTAAFGIWPQRSGVSSVEVLVNMSQMEWVSRASYDRSKHVIVPVGWSLKLRHHNYAVRGRDGNRTLIGMSPTDQTEEVVIRGLQHSNSTEDAKVQTKDFDYLCWKSVE